MQRGPGTFNVAASNKYRTVSPSQRQAMVKEAVSTSKLLTSQDIRKQGKHIFGCIEKLISMYIFKFRHEDIPIETLKKKNPPVVNTMDQFFPLQYSIQILRFYVSFTLQFLELQELGNDGHTMKILYC